MNKLVTYQMIMERLSGKTRIPTVRYDSAHDPIECVNVEALRDYAEARQHFIQARDEAHMAHRETMRIVHVCDIRAREAALQYFIENAGTDRIDWENSNEWEIVRRGLAKNPLYDTKEDD